MTPHKGLVMGGRYELSERIAVGGMGEVWSATDQHLHRKVAVKVLRAEFAGDGAFLARMRAEARNAAGLSHNNVTAMYDYGEQEGAGYLIMELVEGEPMSELLARERTLAAGQLLPILAQTARGLHAAHVGGVVHRDVKPSNLLITRDGTVKITDFGIALGANQAPMTAAGMVMGTAQYLPPEQAMGKAAQGVGDIYALGVIAYEALVGRRPFTGSTQVDIAFAHVNQPVPPLPETIDPRVRDLVMSMLDKDPERRPRSGASLARNLDALHRELQAEAAEQGVQPRASHSEQVAKMPTQGIPTAARAAGSATSTAAHADPVSSAWDGTPTRRAQAGAEVRRRSSPPVVGTSALQIDEHADPEPAPVPEGIDAVAAPVAPSAVAQPVPGRSGETTAATGVTPMRAAGLRRPAMPRRRDVRDAPPSAVPVPEETPDRTMTPQWVPIGRREARQAAQQVAATRPRRSRHGRAALVWSWRTVVKVLVVAVMLIVLALWLGTLAQAEPLSHALGTAGALQVLCRRPRNDQEETDG